MPRSQARRPPLQDFSFRQQLLRCQLYDLASLQSKHQAPRRLIRCRGAFLRLGIRQSRRQAHLPVWHHCAPCAANWSRSRKPSNGQIFCSAFWRAILRPIAASKFSGLAHALDASGNALGEFGRLGDGIDCRRRHGQEATEERRVVHVHVLVWLGSRKGGRLGTGCTAPHPFRACLAAHNSLIYSIQEFNKSFIFS